ncbi:MAG: HAD family hydrolase [Thermoplasmata archaeon]|nr:HAD family hydrolase [Thermoplasmata archaeon]
MPLRAVLWDFDDTLVPVHTLERWQWAWKPQGPRLNERHVRASIREGLRHWDRRRWQGLLGNASAADATAYHDALRDMLFAIADRTLPEVETEAVLARFPKYPGPVEPYADVRPCLESLRARGLSMAVLVGPTGSRAQALLGQLRLAELLPHVFGETGENPAAPAAGAFLSACSKLEVAPDEVTYVGDLFWSDVRAAGRAGLRAVLLDRNDWWARVESARIRSLAELPGRLVSPSGVALDGSPGPPPEPSDLGSRPARPVEGGTPGTGAKRPL